MKNKDLYPENWEAIAEKIRKRDGYQCQHCGVGQHLLGFYVSRYFITHSEALTLYNRLRQGKAAPEVEYTHEQAARRVKDTYRVEIVKIHLNVAHLDRNPANNEESNLLSLCARCHFVYDREYNLANIKYGSRRAEVQYSFLEALFP